MDMTKAIGFIGAAIAGIAYVPQIQHLIVERCSAGISQKAELLWLAASILITIHALAIHEPVFSLLGLVQTAATAAIFFYSIRYSGMVCPSHVLVSSAKVKRKR